MVERCGNRRWVAVGVLALVAGLAGAAKVAAQEPKPAAEAQPAAEKTTETSKAPNTGRLSVSAKAINDGDRVQVIGTLGLAFAY